MENKLEEAMQKLSEAAEVFGFQIVIPNANSEDNVDYILLVNPDKADEIIEKLEK
jgi:hypothetical protein